MYLSTNRTVEIVELYVFEEHLEADTPIVDIAEKEGCHDKNGCFGSILQPLISLVQTGRVRSEAGPGEGGGTGF